MSTYQNEKIPSVVNVLVSLDMIKTQLYGVVMPGLLHHGLADSVHGMQLLNISDTMIRSNSLSGICWRVPARQ